MLFTFSCIFHNTSVGARAHSNNILHTWILNVYWVPAGVAGTVTGARDTTMNTIKQARVLPS